MISWNPTVRGQRWAVLEHGGNLTPLLFFRTSLLHKLRRWPEGSNTLRQVKYIQFQEFQVHSTRFLFVWRCREFLSGFLTDFLSRVYVWSKWSSNVPRRCSTSPVRCRPGTTAARFAFEHCTISIRNAKKRYDTNTYVRMEKVRIEQYRTNSICSSVLLHEVVGRFWMYDNFANLLNDFKWFIVDVAASTLKVCTKEMPGTSGGLQGFIVLLAWSLDDSTFMDARCRRLPCFIMFHHVSGLARFTTGIFGMWPVLSVLHKLFRCGLQNQSSRKTG